MLSSSGLQLYRTVRGTAPAYWKMRRAIREHLPATISTVLDVGGGAGMMQRTVVDSCRPRLLVTTDIDPSDRTDVACDALHLPFKDGCLDAVLAFEVMEHIADTDVFLSELTRVLKRGGRVVLSVPFVFPRHDFRDYYRFTPEALTRLCARHGLAVVAIEKRGGTFLAITLLLNEYVYRVVGGRPTGWRARSTSRRLRLALASAFTMPLIALSWVALALDNVLDRDSESPSGFVLVGQRTAVDGPLEPNQPSGAQTDDLPV